jgi:hypothetical protein
VVTTVVVVVAATVVVAALVNGNASVDVIHAVDASRIDQPRRHRDDAFEQLGASLVVFRLISPSRSTAALCNVYGIDRAERRS